MRILIVDDDRKRASLLKSFLIANKGLDEDFFSFAENTGDAKDFLRNCYFDLLVIDVILPRRCDGDRSSKNGLELLRSINKGGGQLIRPGRVVGITANISEIGDYRRDFSEACVAVVEALPGDAAWRTTIADHLDYDRASYASRFLSTQPLDVMTIHGINTFGRWQKQLERVVKEQKGDANFHNYKYGVFSPLAFLLPPLRIREYRKLKFHLKEKFSDESVQKYFIFTHSFGTLLLYSALKEVILENPGFERKVGRIILSGSVLPHRTDWSLFSSKSIEVINDCADHDYVLYVSQFLVWGCGMAGRCGFYGFNDQSLLNRFFNGGHSSYFKGDGFIRSNWVPLLHDGPIKHSTIDLRKISFIKHGVIDKVAILLGPFTTVISCLLIIYLIAHGLWSIIRSWI